MIPADLKAALERRAADALNPREAAVDVLKSLQTHYGWLTDQAMDEAACITGLSPLQLEELATFYDMLYRRPVGRHVIHACDSISCWNMGGSSLMRSLEMLLGVAAGETTPDGLFTLLPCSCLGNCGAAPAMMISNRPYGPVTAETAAALLKEIRGSGPFPS